MYRIFCNNRIIQSSNFSDELLTWHDKDVDVKSESIDNLIDTMKKWLGDESLPNLIFNDINPADFACAMRAVFHPAPAAGGIVLVENQIVAIERHGIPDLPKGHIEAGESPEIAAVREVMEETGISNLKILEQLPSTWHCYLLNNQWTIKKTSWYLMNTSSDFVFTPQTEEGISKVYLINIGNVKHFLENTFSSIRENLGEKILEILNR